MQEAASARTRRQGGMRPTLTPESRVLRALAPPERLAIVECLRHGSVCVCHLTVALSRPQVYISQQLAILRDAGVIEGRRNGAFVYYRLRDRSVLGIMDSAGSIAGRVRASSRSRLRRLEGCECPQCSAAAPTGRVMR